jgi:hypothetical protein
MILGATWGLKRVDEVKGRRYIGRLVKAEEGTPEVWACPHEHDTRTEAETCARSELRRRRST